MNAEAAHRAGTVAVACRGLKKAFNSTTVLDHVNLDLAQGQVVALVGENGAGKSTLLNIMAGLLPPTDGSLSLFGEAVSHFSPTTAQAHGVQIVTQELSLVPELTVWENIFLGRERTRGPAGLGYIDAATMVREAQAAIDDFGVPISARVRVKSLSLSYAQVVEIVKAINCKPRVLLLDEPTSSLTDAETDHLFAMVRRLREAGITVIFTTHKMNEIQKMADEIVVLRDGAITLTAHNDDISPDEIVSAMVGRELSRHQIKLPEVEPDAAVRLRVRDFSTRAPERQPETINLDLHAGEVIGLAGIAGAGRTSFLEALYGIRRPVNGEVELDGQPFEKRAPGRSIRHGLAYVPEDRKDAGLVLSMGVGQNTTLAKLSHFVSGLGLVNAGAEGAAAEQALKQLHTKYASRKMEVGSLSGGNQQKVLVARWLIADTPRVILLDEPTRGIDVGAKADMYDLIAQLASEGVAVLVASSELPELMLLSHRIAVFKDGVIERIFEREDFSEEEIVKVAIGA